MRTIRRDRRSGLVGCDRRAGGLGGEAAVEEQGGQPEPGVEQEGGLERRLGPAREETAQHLREPGAQGADGAGERADEAVAGEERGAVAVGDGVREPRLLQRQEEADIAGGGVERADEGDQEQRPEALGQSEGDAGQRHQWKQHRSRRARGEAVGVEADEQGKDRGAGQGRGRDQADLERAVPEGGKVGRQQQADQPVAEGAQGPARPTAARPRARRSPGAGPTPATASSSRPRPRQHPRVRP